MNVHGPSRSVASVVALPQAVSAMMMSGYNGFAVRVRGGLDERRFERAVQDTAQRHQILRALVPISEHGRVMSIQEHLPFPMESGDLTHLTELQLARTIADRFGRRKHDDSTWRISFLRYGSDTIVCGLHHTMLHDATSTTLVIDELFRSYDEGPLPPPRRQYADYVDWARHHLEGGNGAATTEFWNRHDRPLHGTGVVSALRTDSANDPSYTNVSLGNAVFARLEEASFDANVSTFEYVYAAYAAALHLESGASRLSVSTAFSGRAAAYANVPGRFAYGVFAHTETDNDLRLAEFAERLSRQVREALPHATAGLAHGVGFQDMPYAFLFGWDKFDDGAERWFPFLRAPNPALLHRTNLPRSLEAYGLTFEPILEEEVDVRSRLRELWSPVPIPVVGADVRLMAGIFDLTVFSNLPNCAPRICNRMLYLLNHSTAWGELSFRELQRIPG